MLLPIRPRPYIGECLGGYVGRLASVNGYDRIQQFGHALSGSLVHQPYNISLARLAEAARLDDVHLERLWLQRDERYGFRYKDVPLPREFIAPGSRFCPLCLEESGYRRAQWNLGWMPVCVTHKVLLAVGCNKCSTCCESARARCTCMTSARKHLVQVDPELVRFIAALEQGVTTVQYQKQWLIGMRKLMTEAYFDQKPYVWNRQYLKLTQMPKTDRCPILPRQIINYYSRLVGSEAA